MINALKLFLLVMIFHASAANAKLYVCEFELSTEQDDTFGYKVIAKQIASTNGGISINRLFVKENLSLNISGELSSSGKMQATLYEYDEMTKKSSNINTFKIKGNGTKFTKFSFPVNEEMYLLITRCTKSK
jgi:hypothetical protein